MTTLQRTSRSLGTAALCALALASGAGAVPSTTQYENPVVTEPTTIVPAQPPVAATPTPTPTTTTTTTTETTTPPATSVVAPRVTKPSAPKSGVSGVLGAATRGVKHALPSAVKVKGTLPFTGLDLSVVLIGGLGAAVAGVGLRRVARRRSG